MQDRFFDHPTPYEGGLWNSPFLDGLKDAAKALGYDVHTTDFWTREKSQPDDVLVVQNHPGETFFWRAFYYLKHFRERGGFILARRKFLYENYSFFKRRVLIQGESPMVMPYVYRNLAAIKRSGIYHKIMVTSREWGNDFDYYNPYDYRDRDIVSPHFNTPKDHFLVLLNSNVRPHSFSRELYGERLKAIRYFSVVDGFDLYGYGWDKLPRHPFYLHYNSYVRRAWRGSVDDKLKTISRYRFSICYENAAYDGYLSEKIYDHLASGTIPVYLGAPDVAHFVPPDCFVDKRKFPTYEKLHQFLASLSHADIAQYRQNILRFLNDRSTMRGIRGLVQDILG
jgi:hypothetical protein